MRNWVSENELADQLIANKRLSAKEIDQARLPNGDMSFRRLNALGLLPDHELLNLYSQVTGLSKVSQADLSDLKNVADTPLSTAFLKDNLILPLGPTHFAIVHPLSSKLREGLIFALEQEPEFSLIEAGEWKRCFSACFEAGSAENNDLLEADSTTSSLLADIDRDAPIVRKVSGWLTEAADIGASDVHFETEANLFKVRFRTDGVLQTVATEDKSLGASVIARLKVMTGLDLGERNRPQDGRTTLVVRGRRLDVRVSVVSTIDGENGVVRLLDRSEQLLDFDGLGLNNDLKNGLLKVLDKRQGLFVVAGPTGSGKTTTLYTCLEQYRDAGLKILSVEDPVEYQFAHVSQVQISERAGRDFAGSLRAFLRHDPDIIMVGEIRDGETARIAVQAALTGHFVLATLHAIDTRKITQRLTDMGVESAQLEASLAAVMAQRLVRRLCQECRSWSAPLPDEARIFEVRGLLVPEMIPRKGSCPSCKATGYSGRLAIAELEVFHGHAFSTPTMAEHALLAVKEGSTDLAELARVELLT